MNEPATSDSLRLHQANERTLLAWVRTGIAFMAFGFAIARFGLFLRQLASVNLLTAQSTHHLSSAWVGAAFVAIGTLMHVLATLRYARIRDQILRSELRSPSPWLVYATGAAAALIGLVMTVLLVRSVAGDLRPHRRSARSASVTSASRHARADRGALSAAACPAHSAR